MGPPPPPRPRSTCRPLERLSRSTASASSCTGPPSASTPTSLGSGEGPGLREEVEGFAGSQVSTRLHRSAPWGAFPPLGACGFLRSCWCLTFQVHNIIVQPPYTAACSPPEPISTTTTRRVPYPSPLPPLPGLRDGQHVVCLYEFAFVLCCLFPGELFKMPMPGPPHPTT